jgi:peptidoglycan/xylan/chitin deacetylase (PgdA/CDA1 family)
MGILDAPALSLKDARRNYVPKSEAAARVMRRAPANRASSGWTIPAQANKDAASTPDYTSDAFFGDRCLRIVTAGTAAQVYAMRTMTNSFDATDCNVRLTFKVTDYDFTTIQVVVANSSASLSSSANIGFTAGGASAPSYAVQSGKWVVLDLPQSKFSGTVNWADVQFVRIGIVDTTGQPTELRLHSIDFVKRDTFGKNPNGMVVITADDSHVTQYTVLRPALSARGWKCTLMPIPGAHGTDSNVFMTDAQVQELHDTDGWEVGAHCYDVSSHALGLPNLTQAQRLNEFEAVRSWQKSLGFSSPSHSYPLGTHDAATEADVAKYWTASRLAASHGFNETTSPARRYSIMAENITAGATAIGAAATKAHNEKGVLFIMLHAIVASGGDANAVTPTVLTAVLDAIAASGCDVVTMEEALSRMGL